MEYIPQQDGVKPLSAPATYAPSAYHFSQGDLGGGDAPTPTASAPPPAAPPAGPASNIQTGSGWNPDYAGLIKNDPAYVAAQQAAQAAQARAAANRRMQIRQWAIRYGGMPSGFKDIYGDLDKGTLSEASGNQHSTLAQLHSNYQQSVEQFRRSLAARGMLQSGDLGYGQDQLNRGESQQEYDAGNQTLDQFGNAVNAYGGVLDQNAQNLVAAIQAAEGNVYGNPAYRPVAPTYAQLDPTGTSIFGQPVYKDGNGQWYDANGQPIGQPGYTG